VSTLWAMQNGYFDDVPVEKVKETQKKLEEYLTTRKDAVLGKIRNEKALTDEINGDLKSALDEFKSTHK
jgi:F-type H+-transporting ATPase subunit alpha